MDLREHYLSYISRINRGECAAGGLNLGLSPFVHEGVIHNDSPPMTVDEYARLISDSQRELPGLYFDAEMLVVESATQPDQHPHPHSAGQSSSQGAANGTVAARLKLTYKPTPGTDETEAFYEHVFYRFQGGKISRVWSLLDGAGLRWKEERDAASR